METHIFQLLDLTRQHPYMLVVILTFQFVKRRR